MIRQFVTSFVFRNAFSSSLQSGNSSINIAFLRHPVPKFSPTSPHISAQRFFEEIDLCFDIISSGFIQDGSLSSMNRIRSRDESIDPRASTYSSLYDPTSVAHPLKRNHHVKTHRTIQENHISRLFCVELSC